MLVKNNIIEVDSNYSTTRCLSKQKPLVVKGQDNKINSILFSSTENKVMHHGGLRCSGYFKHSLPDQLLITVVTVVYNGEMHLEQTIQSVINQTYNNVEYIVIDGGSNDGTVDIIRQYENKIDYWVSETDGGIADAMNKGISLSTGEYIVFIHADDYLECNNILKTVIKKVNKSDIILLDILYGKKLTKSSPRGFNFWMNFKTGVYHQASLCRSRIFKSIGGFDTDFKVAMDYDFFLRTYRRDFTIQKLPYVLSVMRDTGISSRRDAKSVMQRLYEERMVHEKNCSGLMMKYIYEVYWLLYTRYKKLFFTRQIN